MNNSRAASSDFRQQLLWQKAQEFAVALAELIKTLPRDRSVDVIANQLLRSGGSIAANIAEGYGRYSQGAYRNHLSIARGSAFESKSWVDLLVRLHYLSAADAEMLFKSCTEIEKLITYRMKTLSTATTYAVREEGSLYDAN